MQNGHTGFSIGPNYATFYKSGGGTVRLRNITIEQVRDAIWLLVPLGVILVTYGLEVFFSRDLSKEYEGLFVGYMLAAGLCIFRVKVDKVIIFGSLGYIAAVLGESGIPPLASFDAFSLITLSLLCLVLTSLPGFLEKIWSHLLALVFVVIATLPPTMVFQNLDLVAKLDGYDNELVGGVNILLGFIILFQVYLLYIMHRAVEEEKALVVDDSYPHPDDY